MAKPKAKAPEPAPVEPSFFGEKNPSRPPNEAFALPSGPDSPSADEQIKAHGRG